MKCLALAPFSMRALAAVALAVGAGACGGGGLDLGAPLPAVAAPDHQGNPVNLANAGGTGYTLVYFYPKADSPGCTAQAQSLRDGWDELSSAGVRVFGVSVDTKAAQKTFKEQHELPFTLLADEDHRVIDAFGVPRPGGFAKRQAYLFRDGRLVWRDLDASTARQAEDVLAAVRTS